MGNAAESISAADSWLRMSLALAFVIGLVFLSAWLMKKVAAGRFLPGQTAGGAIRVLSRIPIGEKRYLMVVAVSERFLLLGVTAQSVNLIAELDQFQVDETDRESLFERMFKSAGKRTEEGRL